MAKSRGPRAPKVRATYHLPEDIVDEARNCVIFLSGPPLHLTLSRLVEKALRAEVERLKRSRNEGKEFPKGDPSVLGGRPIDHVDSDEHW
ncbi:MAG: type II toxin-antitoxin system CcdA family antitoxin [Actinobacteria bacterium]|nr:type II toxin-antitoxin system CcdA family antitoxin [Actinomycetota bacterium]